jgi:chemotaxis protein MotB
MPLGRARRRPGGVDYWPGFVDALSTMLLVIIFLLSVFMLSQFFLSREVSGKDSALTELNRQIEQLTQLLSLERVGKTDNQAELNALAATLEAANREKARLQGALASTDASKEAQSGKAAAAASELDQQKQGAARATAQMEILNQQITALRRQLAAVEQALGASESRDKESQTRIADLGQRLNVALAQKVQELARYRSDFFGRLRQILGNRPEIRVVGDRFVFQSEVFFDSGQAVLAGAGKGDHRSRARDTARHPLGPACRRPYRQATDPVSELPLELGAVGVARHCRRAISDDQGRVTTAARRRRVWRIPADRPGRNRRGAEA